MAGTISNTITSSYTLTVTPTTISNTGAVAVTSGAAIYGPDANPWSVLNFGSIGAGTSSTGGHGPNGFGVDLIDGGAVTNASGATIAGRVGVGMAGASATISNSESATIAGGYKGLAITVSQSAALYNAGTISGNGYTGIDVGVTGSASAGAILTNAATGLIEGKSNYVYGFGVRLFGSAAQTVVNAGSIEFTGVSSAAVDLLNGGYVTNQAGGVIAGGGWGIFVGSGSIGTGVIVNAGSVIGTAKNGVDVDGGGTVTNEAGGIFSGKYSGVLIWNGPRSVVNHGLITGSIGLGINLQVGYVGPAYVSNTGSIIGATGGLGIVQTLGTVINSGLIRGTAGGGIYLKSGGSVTNASSGTIEAIGGTNSYGVYLGLSGHSAGTVVNQGVITAPDNSGISVYYGGAVTNAAGGIISGSSSDGQGINVYRGGYITNAASAMITGYNGVQFFNQPGSVSNAGVILGSEVGPASAGVHFANGGNVENLATGTIGGSEGVYFGNAAGTLSNAGTIAADPASGTAVTFGAGFANRLVVVPGAVFKGGVDGGNTVAGSIASTLELAGGAGTGTLAGLGSQVVDFGTVSFDAGAAWLVSGNAAGLASGQTLDGFAIGDTIELTGLTETIEAYSGGTLTLAGDEPLSLGLPGPFTTESFVATQVSAGTDITVACYAAGTRILTARGEVAVETLRVGEMVCVSRAGGLLPIVWLGRRQLRPHQHPHPQDLHPVRVAAGALADGVPARDLWLSPEHAVFLHGVLVPIRTLINGTSISQVAAREIIYWHVELPRHDVLLAEGAWSESYLDMGNRNAFEGAVAEAATPLALHPDFAARFWQRHACAPQVRVGPMHDVIRSVIDRRAAACAAAPVSAGIPVNFRPGSA